MNTTPDRRTGTFVNRHPNQTAPKPPIQPAKVNAIPVTQNGRGLQCFDCKKWGHRRGECPNKGPRRGSSTTLPPQERKFANQRGNPSPRENQGPAKPVKINYVSVSDEAEEHAEV